jgi:hypothetical protein
MVFLGEREVRSEVGYCYYLAAENPLDRETLAFNGDDSVGFVKKCHRSLLWKSPLPAQIQKQKLNRGEQR